MKKYITVHSKYDNFEWYMNDCLVFVGSNHVIKEKIYQLIHRSFQGNTYSDVEETYFGENGIKITIDKKVMTTRKIKYISIANLQDFIDQFSIEKKNMFDQLMISTLTSFELSHLFERFHNILLEIEMKLNEEIMMKLPNIELQIESFSSEVLYRKFSKIFWVEENKEQLEYMMNSRIIIDNFCSLLENYLKYTEEYVCLQLKYPDIFLSEEDMNYFAQRLITMNNQYQKIYLFIYHYNYCSDYDIKNFSSLVLCLDNITQQLPEFDDYYSSIKRNYPIEMEWKDEDLYHSTLRIVPYVGRKYWDNGLISSKDMIILKLLNHLVRLDNLQVSSCSDLTDCEQQFLYF